MPSMPEAAVSKKPLVIIGNEDIVVGFESLGFKAYPAKEKQECKHAVAEVVEDKAMVCLLQEELYPLVKDEINACKNAPLPVFIPFTKEKVGTLLDTIIKDIRLRATGAF